MLHQIIAWILPLGSTITATTKGPICSLWKCLWSLRCYEWWSTMRASSIVELTLWSIALLSTQSRKRLFSPSLRLSRKESRFQAHKSRKVETKNLTWMDKRASSLQRCQTRKALLFLVVMNNLCFSINNTKVTLNERQNLVPMTTSLPKTCYMMKVKTRM